MCCIPQVDGPNWGSFVGSASTQHYLACVLLARPSGAQTVPYAYQTATRLEGCPDNMANRGNWTLSIGRGTPSTVKRGVCFLFNRPGKNKCHFNKCKYEHICSVCRDNFCWHTTSSNKSIKRLECIGPSCNLKTSVSDKVCTLSGTTKVIEVLKLTPSWPFQESFHISTLLYYEPITGLVDV